MNCNTCNQEFIITKDRTIFCSHTCQAKWAIKKAIEKRKPRPKTGSYKNCLVCQKQFYVKAYRLKIKACKFCSRSCLAKFHLKKYSKLYGFKKTFLPPHTYKTIKIDGKQVRLHRYIMESFLERKLESHEHIHHINGNSRDNHISNLKIVTNSEHQKLEHEFRKKLLLWPF